MKGNKRRNNRYNKSDDFIAGIKNVYVNVQGGCMWSSARMGDIVRWYGRVVDVCSWMFDEGSWRRSSRGDTARCLMRVSWGRSGCWMQLDGRSGKLKSVESLNAAGWLLLAAEVGWVIECSWMVVAGSWGRSVVGKSMSRFWHFVGMVESWLLARNSESLRGLVVAMLGQSMTASRYVDWMLHCRSIVVGRSISRFWQYVGLTGGVSICLLAHNSESLCGPDVAMLV